MTEPKAEFEGLPTSDQAVKMYDLHVEVLRANRRLDAAFPPFLGEQYAAIRDRAEALREKAEALRDHLDSMRSNPPGQDAE